MPPARLQSKLPANAKTDSDNAAFWSIPMAVDESSATYKFSLTPIPLGVIGRALIHITAGTISITTLK